MLALRSRSTTTNAPESPHASISSITANRLPEFWTPTDRAADRRTRNDTVVELVTLQAEYAD
jgi:hypothetical protein